MHLLFSCQNFTNTIPHPWPSLEQEGLKRGCYCMKEMNSPYFIRRNRILNALQHCLSCDLVWSETISNMKWVIGYGHSVVCLLHEGIYMWAPREI